MAGWEDAPTVRLSIPSRRRVSVAWRVSVAVCISLMVLTAAGVGGLWWSRVHGPAGPVAAPVAAPLSTPVAPVARDAAPSTTRPTTKRPAPATSRSSAAATSSVAAFAGEWQAHGFSVTFDASGRGTADFRTYVWCTMPQPGVPCEDPDDLTDAGHATVQLQPGSSGALRMRVVSSNDQTDWPTGTTFTLTPKRRGVLEVDGRGGSWGLCRPPATDEICGA